MSICKKIRIFGLTESSKQETFELLTLYKNDIISYSFGENLAQPSDGYYVNVEFTTTNTLCHFLDVNSVDFNFTPLPSQVLPLSLSPIYVNNLPPLTTAELKSQFAEFASLITAQLLFDKQTLQFKNAAIIFFKNPAEAQFCVQKYYNRLINGYQIKLYPNKYEYQTV